MAHFRYTETVLSLLPNDFALHIPLSTNFLTWAYLVLLIIWFMHMVITRYHWSKYGHDKLRVLRMNIYYFTGSILLFSTLALFLIFYSSSIPSA